jgi:CRISPR-associated protein Csx10
MRLLEAILQSPTHLACRHEAGNYAESLPYIPGTAIRGAIAGCYLSDAALRDRTAKKLGPAGTFEDYFDWLFLSGEVVFPNLYPAVTATPALVLPLSARTCKYHPGFRGDERTRLDECHGVADLLLIMSSAVPTRCHRCQAPLEAVEGFYAVTSLKPVRRVRPRAGLLTRTAVEPAVGTARQGALYTVEVIDECGDGALPFTGILHNTGSAPAAHSPRASYQEVLLDDLGTEFANGKAVIYLGGDRTRGLGAVRLQLGPEVPGLPMPSLRDRIATTFQRRPNSFTLTLHTDAIVIDELFRYQSVIDEAFLRDEFPGGPECALDRAFTATRVVSGWNSAHKLPKENALAISKGAAFLYSTTASEEQLLPWLQEIERIGIGERRSEGFGEVVVCHPFHLEEYYA